MRFSLRPEDEQHTYQKVVAQQQSEVSVINEMDGSQPTPDITGRRRCSDVALQQKNEAVACFYRQEVGTS